MILLCCVLPMFAQRGRGRAHAESSAGAKAPVGGMRWPPYQAVPHFSALSVSPRGTAVLLVNEFVPASSFLVHSPPLS
jgi:hypothetical protein